MGSTCRAPAHGRRRLALALLAFTVAGGCTSLAPIDPAPQVYHGRFSASIDRGDQREAVAGRFTLAASARQVTLDLASPLGNTLARVAADDSGATLTAPQADGSLATWHGDNADALAEAVLGYRLPVTGLADWLAGRAVPGRAAIVLPDRGPVQRIEQDGWVIAIDERFEQDGAPRRLSFERDHAGPQAPALRLRLVLDDAGSAPGAADRHRP